MSNREKAIPSSGAIGGLRKRDHRAPLRRARPSGTRSAGWPPSGWPPGSATSSRSRATPTPGVWKAVPVAVAVQLAGRLLAGPLSRPLAPRLVRGDRRAPEGRGPRRGRCSSSSTSRCAGCPSACRSPPSTWPSWPWPPCATGGAWSWSDTSVPTDEGTLRVLVFGAGEGAEQVITAMLRDPEAPTSRSPCSTTTPSAGSSGSAGVQVCGTRGGHRRGGQREASAEVLLIAVPSADGALVRELAQLGHAGRPEGAGGPAGEGPLRRGRGAGRHPTAHHRRPARPPRDRHRRRRHRRLPHRPPGARHRGGRLDRLRAVPTGAPASGRPRS